MEQCIDNNSTETTVNVSKRAYASLISELKEFKKQETGGVFLGYKDKNEWYIIESTFAGPCAEHKSASFEYDYEYTEYEISKLKSIYNIDLYILGLWHSHITGSDFSYADDDANAKFAMLNDFGAISAIFDICQKRLRFFEVKLPLSYIEVDYRIYEGSENDYRKDY